MDCLIDKRFQIDFSFVTGRKVLHDGVVPFLKVRALHIICHKPAFFRNPLKLHFSPQVRATVPASTCNRSCKYLQPSLQVRATIPASTCGKMPFLESLPSHVFSTERNNLFGIIKEKEKRPVTLSLGPGLFFL